MVFHSLWTVIQRFEVGARVVVSLDLIKYLKQLISAVTIRAQCQPGKLLCLIVGVWLAHRTGIFISSSTELE